MNTVFKSKIFKVFEQCEAHNPLAVVYALSVQSFKHYNRLARRSCVVRVLGKWNCDARTLSHDHIITSPLGTRWLSCFDSGDARWALELLTKSPPRPIEDICVCPEATLMMSQKHLLVVGFLKQSICTLGSLALSTACTLRSASSSCESLQRKLPGG